MASDRSEQEQWPRTEFTEARAWPAEGARVALVTCLTCAAAVLLDPADDFDARWRHDQFHLAQAALFGSSTQEDQTA